MHRTQISLEPGQYELLMLEARQRGISLAAVVRLLIEEQLAGKRRKRQAERSPLSAIKGLGAGSGERVGRNHNRFLYGDTRK